MFTGAEQTEHPRPHQREHGSDRALRRTTREPPSRHVRDTNDTTRQQQRQDVQTAATALAGLDAICIAPTAGRAEADFRVEHDDGTPLLLVCRDSRLAERVGAIMITLGVIAAAGLPIIMLASVQMTTSMRLGVLAGGLTLAVAVGVIFLVGLWPKRHVRLYGSDHRPPAAATTPIGVAPADDFVVTGSEYLMLLQDRGLPFLGRSYTIADSDLHLVGWISRSLWRDGMVCMRWHCYDGQGELVCVISEDSAVKAVLRYVFNAVGAAFPPADYKFCDPQTDLTMARLTRSSSSDDRHRLDLREDSERHFDRRLAVAAAILLEIESDY